MRGAAGVPQWRAGGRDPRHLDAETSFISGRSKLDIRARSRASFDVPGRSSRKCCRRDLATPARSKGSLSREPSRNILDVSCNDFPMLDSEKSDAPRTDRQAETLKDREEGTVGLAERADFHRVHRGILTEIIANDASNPPQNMILTELNPRGRTIRVPGACARRLCT